MARPKLIEDTELLNLIMRYFREECGGSIKKLKTAEVVRYINNHGYPEYPATTLRRTPAAMELIEKLKASITNDEYITVAAYQTIDAAALVDSNRSRDALIKAITDRDSYYKVVAASATNTFDRYNQLLDQHNAISAQKAALEEKAATLETQLERTLERSKDMEKTLKAYKSVVDTYLYPEIANELLAKEGAIRKTDQLIDPAVLDNNLITPETKIRKGSKSGSDVIEGLLELEE